MKLHRKWAIVAGTILVSGALLTGAAFAAGATGTTDGTTAVDKAAKVLTKGEKQVWEQLSALRQSYMEKYKADAKGVIEHAVKEGKLTQEQADKMTQHQTRAGKMHGGKGHMGKNMTAEELKAKLDEAVKDGKLTQEQADRMLEMHAKRTQKQ